MTRTWNHDGKSWTKIWSRDIYSIMDEWRPECADLTAELRRIARHLVRDGMLHTHEPEYQYHPSVYYSPTTDAVRGPRELEPHVCDDCREPYACDDRKFAKAWKVVQVSAVDYWRKGIKSPARILRQRIAKIGVIHFNNRMYCPRSVIEKDINSLFARAHKMIAPPGQATVMVDGIAVPIVLSKQKVAKPVVPKPAIDISTGYVIEPTWQHLAEIESPHQHGWRVIESGITDLCVPLWCECGAVGFYERTKDCLTIYHDGVLTKRDLFLA